MKSSEKNIQNLDSAFDSLFDNHKVDYEIEAKVLASKILSEISNITDKKELNRKSVASLIGTSASYLTQLYRGTKLLNLITLAKLKDKLDLDVEIKIKENRYNNLEQEFDYAKLTKEITHATSITKWAIYTNSDNNVSDSLNDVEVSNSTSSNKKQLTA